MIESWNNHNPIDKNNNIDAAIDHFTIIDFLPNIFEGCLTIGASELMFKKFL